MRMSFIFGKDNVGNIDRTEDEVMISGINAVDEATESGEDIRCEGGESKCTPETGEDTNKVTGYVPIHFLETRKYLQQVRDLKRSIRLMENRIGYRRDAGYDISWHEQQLESMQTQLKITTADVAEEISKLGDVNQEVVMTKRYIDVMSWDEIAETSDLKMRTVQKCHGHALPVMEQILLADGLITLEDIEDDLD